MTIDTAGPSARSIVSITTSPGTAILGVGATVILTLTLSEPVIIDTAGGLPSLTLNDGGTAVLTGINAAHTVLTARYTVLAGQNTADLAVTGVNLNGATITDLAGNQTDTTGAAINPAGVLQIETAAPPAPSPPALALSSDSGVSDTDGITNITRPIIAGSAATGDLMTLFDTDGATVLGTATAVDGAWSITPTVVALSEGTHSLTVTDKDVAGNTSLASAPLQVTIDTVGPNAGSILSIKTSPDTGILGIGGNVTLTITLGERVILDTTDGTPSLTLNDGGTAVLTGIDATNTVLTAGYTVLAGQNTADLAVIGLNLNGATITDIAGNQSDMTGVAINPDGVLQIDTTAPTTPGTPDLLTASDSGASNTDNITNVTTPVLTGTGGEVGATVALLDGGTTIGTGTVATGGIWSIKTNILGEGPHTVTATQTDTAGNTSVASATLNVTLDTTAPTAPSTPDLATADDSGASSTDDITNVTLPTFTGTGEDGATVTLLDGATTIGTGTVAVGGAWSITATHCADRRRQHHHRHPDRCGRQYLRGIRRAECHAEHYNGGGGGDGGDGGDGVTFRRGPRCRRTGYPNAGFERASDGRYYRGRSHAYTEQRRNRHICVWLGYRLPDVRLHSCGRSGRSRFGGDGCEPERRDSH
jgi:hypothetical protein